MQVFNLAFVLWLLKFSPNAIAGDKMISTVVTCQQEEAARWIEVGIVDYHAQGLRAFVVEHEEHTSFAKLIVDRSVSMTDSRSFTKYSDRSGKLILTIAKMGDKAGNFDLTLQGMEPIHLRQLYCLENSSIIFDSI